MVHASYTHWDRADRYGQSILFIARSESDATDW